MDSHIKSYELYCSVVGRNIIVEETFFHNGTRSAKCLNGVICQRDGGCKNSLLCERLFKNVEKRRQG